MICAVTADQMRRVDELAVGKYGVFLEEMMELAGFHLASLARRVLDGSLWNKSVVVLAGKGNNGGGRLMRIGELVAFLRLVRLDYSFFIALGVCLSGLLAEDLDGFQLEYLVAFLIVFFSAMSSFAFNDYFDFEVDKRNERSDRPLVSGLLSRKAALATALISISIVVFLSLYLNWVARAIVLVNSPLFVLYNLGLKKQLLVKNMIVAYAYVVTIVFGALVSDIVLEPLIGYFAVMGFLVGLGFEVMLDVGDVAGDRALGIATFSTRFGVSVAARISVALYCAIMFMDPLPFLLNIDPRLFMDYVFLTLISIPITFYSLVTRSLWRDQSRENISRLKTRVFLTMQIGCAAYLVGVLI